MNSELISLAVQIDQNLAKEPDGQNAGCLWVACTYFATSMMYKLYSVEWLMAVFVQINAASRHPGAKAWKNCDSFVGMTMKQWYDLALEEWNEYEIEESDISTIKIHSAFKLCRSLKVMESELLYADAEQYPHEGHWLCSAKTIVIGLLRS
jgi:hypothetical protein